MGHYVGITNDIRDRLQCVEVETIHISDALNVDLAPDGTVYGIELLNANEQLRASDNHSRAGMGLVFSAFCG